GPVVLAGLADIGPVGVARLYRDRRVASIRLLHLSAIAIAVLHCDSDVTGAILRRRSTIAIADLDRESQVGSHEGNVTDVSEPGRDEAGLVGARVVAIADLDRAGRDACRCGLLGERTVAV